MPHAPKVQVLTPHASLLRSLANSCHCKCMCIIENRKRGTSRPEVWFAHTKTARQTDSGHLGISLLTFFSLFLIFHFFTTNKRDAS